MIVDRRTFVVKKGRMGEAAQLLRDSGRKQSDDTVSGKVMMAEVGPFDVICTELTFEDWDAYHAFWTAGWVPDDAWWEKWNAVTESGGTHEVWRVLE